VERESDIGELVRRARKGEPEASAELVRRHLRPAYLVALAVVRTPSEAEDLAQEGMLIAFQRLEECHDPARFAAWLLQIVRNRARNARLRNRLASLLFRGAREPPPVVLPREENAGLRKRLLGALEQLSPRQREVVLLHDLEGWTHPEIASALGLTEINSRQHLFQARRLLRGLLQDTQPEESSHG